MASYLGYCGQYRIHSTGDDVTTASTDRWPPPIHVEFVDTTAITAGAAKAVRQFEQDVGPSLADLEVIPEPPPPWLGSRPPKMPSRAFTRRPHSTRRRRRTEAARRQKAVKPP